MKLRTMLIGVCAAVLLAGSVSFAQDAAAGNDVQTMRVGAALGVWHALGFSAGVEKIVDKVAFEDFMIDGTWGVGAELGYASREDTYTYYGGEYGWKYTYIPFFVYGSYHHTVENPKYDPFIKLGLGYVYVKSSEIGTFYYGSGYSADASYVDLVSQIGFRYILNDKMAVVGTLGHPWLAGIGIDITLK